MEKLYTIDFSDHELFSDTPVETLPDWCTYPLHFARQRRCFQLKDAYILSQQLNQRPFFIDLVQLNADNAISVRFDVHSRQLLLFFMLQGKIQFTTADYQPIIYTDVNNFLMSFFEIGQYSIHATTGTHIALIVNIASEWIESINGTSIHPGNITTI